MTRAPGYQGLPYLSETLIHGRRLRARIETSLRVLGLGFKVYRVRGCRKWDLGVPYFGVLIIMILLFRVLY